MRVGQSTDAFAVVDDLAPIWPGINPSDAAALCTFKVRQYVGPLPFRQVVQLHGRRMPTALARVTIRECPIFMNLADWGYLSPLRKGRAAANAPRYGRYGDSARNSRDSLCTVTVIW